MSFTKHIYHIVFRTKNSVPVIKNYIANQKEHHLKCSYFDEIKILLDEDGIKYDEKYL